MENNNVLELNHPYLSNMDYTTQQMILPLDLGKKLNPSDPLFSFLKVMEGVNWNKYLSHPIRKGREEYNPFKMIKIVLFAFMRLNFMMSKLSEYIECASMCEWTPEEIQSLIDKLTKVIEKQGIQYVYRKGKHKTPLQRLYDDLIKYRGILENCIERINLCGPDRNSCSKTDHDAMMMH